MECRRRALTRRAFIRQGASVGGLLGLGSTVVPALTQPERPRVGIARSPRVLADGAVDAEVVGAMIDRAVMWAVGIDSADRAWSSLFSSDEVVGIKPNGLADITCSTAPEVVAHCVQRLHGVGVRPESIIIWDETPGHLAACGVPPDEAPWGARAYLTHDHIGDTVENGRFRDGLFLPLQREIDAILNLPILKCHPICGVTMAMKNHYGSIGHPADQHFDNCHTPIADLSAIADIRDKTRLVVCDGTRALIEGQALGPPQYFPNIVMAATDVVAHDAVGARIIEEERERRGIPPLNEVGLEPRYIAMAEERGLGVASLEAIDYQVIDLP